jgi:hypothetical protein
MSTVEAAPLTGVKPSVLGDEPGVADLRGVKRPSVGGRAARRIHPRSARSTVSPPLAGAGEDPTVGACPHPSLVQASSADREPRSIPTRGWPPHSSLAAVSMASGRGRGCPRMPWSPGAGNRRPEAVVAPRRVACQALARASGRVLASVVLARVRGERGRSDPGLRGLGVRAGDGVGTGCGRRVARARCRAGRVAGRKPCAVAPGVRSAR